MKATTTKRLGKCEDPITKKYLCRLSPAPVHSISKQIGFNFNLHDQFLYNYIQTYTHICICLDVYKSIYDIFDRYLTKCE